MKMKILLLHLPLNSENNDSVTQPYGLACISSYLKSRDCDVTLCDANALALSDDQTMKMVDGLKPDLVGLTVYTCHLPNTIKFLNRLKKAYPDIVTVVGGPHPSSEERVSLLEQHPVIDFAVVGEGEFTMYELVDHLQRKLGCEDIRGLVYRCDGKVIETPAREFIQDLDAMPMADWVSLPMDKYWGVSSEKKNLANVLFSRGCLYQCTFCGSKVALGDKVRRRSPQSILAEIYQLYHKYGVREVCINDATFNVDNKWATEITEGILKLNKKDLVWGCNLRANNIDANLLRLMKRSRCTNVFMGIESGDDRMLASMKKGTNVTMIKEAVRQVDRAGIRLYCGFILGMPGETKESIQNTLALAREFSKYSIAFSVATPFPGTEFYSQAKAEGLEVRDWADFDYHALPYVPVGMTRDELSGYYRQALRLYLSFPFVLGQLRGIRSFSQFLKTARLGYRILFHRSTRINTVK